MTLGEKIKQLRTEQGLTQPQLAERAGIEQSYLSKLENDKATPSYDIIARVAGALQTDAMGLIASLDHAWIAAHLSHVPEVAAEYAAIRRAAENRHRRLFIGGAMLIVIGIGLVLAANLRVLFSGQVYIYQSDGVIRAGESLLQFQTEPIEEFRETSEEAAERLRNNKNRFDRVYFESPVNRGDHFVMNITDGRRHFRQVDVREEYIQNGLTAVLGMLSLCGGFFVLLYAFRFRSV